MWSEVCDVFSDNEQTNDEWRKTCSTEEFAVFLAGIVDDLIMLAWKIKNHCCDDEKEAAMRWLKEKHNA